MSGHDERAERRRFALEVFQRMIAAGVTDARYDPEAFAVHFSGERETLELADLFEQVRGLPPDRRTAWLDETLPTLITTQPGSPAWEEVRPALRTVLQDCMFQIIDPVLRLRRPAFGYLDEVVVLGQGPGVELAALDEWGVTDDDVFAAARENLAADNSHVPACLLLPGWLESLPGRPVAFIPDQDTLLIVDADGEVEAAFKDALWRYSEAAQPLSPQGYTVDGQRVVEFDAALHGQVRAAIVARETHVTSVYEKQRKWLWEQPEEADDIRWAGPPKVVRRTFAGHYVLASVWPHDGDATLADVEFVSFGYQQTDLCLPFDLVAAITRLTPVPGLVPPVYWTHGWPEPEIMVVLREAGELFATSDHAITAMPDEQRERVRGAMLALRADRSGSPAQIMRQWSATWKQTMVVSYHDAPSAGFDDLSFDDLRAGLRPLLLPCTSAHERSPLRRPFLPYLDEVVWWEMEGRLGGYVTRDAPETWGMTVDEVFAAARENLAELVSLEVLPAGKVTRVGGIDTRYTPSCLLLPGWLETVTQEFHHRPVVFIPNHDRLLVMDCDPNALEGTFTEVLQLYRAAEHPLSPQCYALDDAGQLSQCDHIVDMPVYPAFAAHEELQTKSRNVQLRRLIDEHGGPLPWTTPTWSRPKFAGSFALVSAWGAELDASLIEADLILIDEGRARNLIVPFHAAVSLAGLTPMPGTRPSMYQVQGLPSPQVMEQLRAADEIFRRFTLEIKGFSHTQLVVVRREISRLGGRIAGTPAADVLEVLPRECDRILTLARMGPPDMEDATTEPAELAYTYASYATSHVLLSAVHAMRDEAGRPQDLRALNAIFSQLQSAGGITITQQGDKVNFDLSVTVNSTIFLLDFLVKQVADLSDTSRNQVILSLFEMIEAHPRKD